MIPGSNLLKQALTVIAKQPVDYYQYLSRSTNAIGMFVSIYADPITIRGSFQPVPRNFYQQYGLDLSKSYYTFYTLNDIFSLDRDVAGDKIVAYGKEYQCQSNNDWFSADKWKGVLCIGVPD